MKILTRTEREKPRKRRLRKKLRVGEFQELGFEVRFTWRSDAEQDFDEKLDAWIDFVESKGWAFGGGGSIEEKTIKGFIAKFGRGALREEDRLQAEKWFEEKEWIGSFEVGLLKDAWHDT
jgi:uncharacterized protein YggL (DUF469 family)